MGYTQRTAIILVILGLVYTSYTSANSSEEDDDSFEDFDVYNSIDSSRNGKTLWSSPKSNAEELSRNIQKKIQNGGTRKDKRGKRFLHYYSYPQSPIIDLMQQTMAVNYGPKNQDIFDFLRDSYPLPKGYSKPLDEYDYVIVGAGSAGSALAARLTEDKPKATVLVIEAGRPEMLLGDIPMFAPYLQLTDYTWPYTMEHQPGVCLGSAEQRCYTPRGKAVGGSSVTNNMLYTRGRPQDWDRIAADGNYGWSYQEVLPYFMKSQKSEVKKYKDTPYTGREGDLYVSNVPFKTGLAEAFLEAGRVNGNPTVDYNAPDGLGFGYIQTTTHRGHRWSSAKAFLHPHKRRRNLHILPEARATKLIIESQTKRAYAVEYTRHNKKYTVRCRREIILSAGPVASPQLLMLSGIGPEEHLRQLGIPVLANLQVGRTLFNHITFPGVIFQLNSTNASLLEPKVATLPNLIQWMHYGEGLLTSPGTVEGLGYIQTEISDDQEPVPDVELLSLGGSFNYDAGGIFRQSWKITDKTYYTAWSALAGKDTWSALPLLLHPKSRGYLELRDTNPFSHPKIYGNLFTDPKDIRTMIAAIRYIVKLGQSEPFKKYSPKLHQAQFPGCEVHAFGSDEYWECAIRTVTLTMNDQIGTCKMGPPTDPEAIVDPELRVYGVEGLRVVDSSVIPRTISAHTTAPAIMIAEKAADMIRRTWANVVYS